VQRLQSSKNQKIIEPLSFEARKRNDAFDKAFARLHTQLTAHFIKNFCLPDGDIDWEKIVAMNSQATRLWKS